MLGERLEPVDCDDKRLPDGRESTCRDGGNSADAQTELYAARAYSLTIPPRRSRRTIFPVLHAVAGCGGRSPSDR